MKVPHSVTIVLGLLLTAAAVQAQTVDTLRTQTRHLERTITDEADRRLDPKTPSTATAPYGTTGRNTRDDAQARTTTDQGLVRAKSKSTPRE